MKVLALRLKPTVIEGGLIAFVVVLWAALTLLQYHWTGQISEATTARSRASLDQQVQQLGQSFDAELAESRDALMPVGEKIGDATREAVHTSRLRRWQAGKHRPIFRRLAVAVPASDKLRLYLLDQQTQKLTAAEWPTEWSALRQNLETRYMTGHGPIFSDRTGILHEYPVFGAEEPKLRGESEWMIFELDLNYLRQRWLPSLMQTYLHLNGRSIASVSVRTTSRSSDLIYESSPGAPEPHDPAASVGLNSHGPGGEPRAAARNDYYWKLTAWQVPDALESAVAAARWRNLALAGVLNLLMVAGGLAIIHFARRSRRLAEAQMQFVANVSHELRTPLTVIRGASHNLVRGIVREPAQIEQYGQLIRQHAEQLTAMIEQVLEYARARQDQQGLARQPVALAGVLEEAIQTTAADTQAAGCRVHTDIAPDLPLVSGDAPALRRVFQNLLTNAAKHGGSGGRIEVMADCTNGQSPPRVRVQVTDFGPGIPVEEQASIFAPFVRGSGAQARQVRGSGLGLSLVREIVEAHRGAVAVQSRPGKPGATFTVTIPASPDA